jgi:hypothetical protein
MPFENDVEDLGDSEGECESEEELYIATILDREAIGGHLQYHVRLKNDDTDWYDRSDLYDFGPNTMYMNAYDKKYPITWDSVCAFCTTDFRFRSEGCEECRCDECGTPCRHLDGVNYGCVKHPVI